MHDPAQPVRLVIGRHRLEAAKLLGWTEIPAVIMEANDLDRELAEIDQRPRTKVRGLSQT